MSKRKPARTIKPRSASEIRSKAAGSGQPKERPRRLTSFSRNLISNQLLERYFLAANPANAFFYLLTGLHGLHLLGGLVALVLTIDKVLWRGCELGQVRLSVKLCAVYWHYLLLLWLVLFTLLTPWVGDFAVICRQLLS